MTREKTPSCALFLGLLAATIAAIWAFPQPILADQSFIKNALDPFGPYPIFETGVLSNLLMKGIGAVFPLSIAHVNEVVRSLAAVFYASAAYLLFSEYIEKERNRLIAVALLFSSRLPLLWLSSELIAGGFLSMAIFLHARGRFRAASAALGCFALCKPDLVLAGGAVLAAWLFYAKGNRRQLLWPFAFVIVALNAGGVLAHGIAHFQGNRSWMAFSQHYSFLFGRHQFDPAFADETFGNWKRNVGAVFPGISSLGGVIVHHPMLYLDFLALGQVHFVKRLVALGNFLLLPMGLILFNGRYRKALTSERRLELLTASAAAACVGLLPITMISFVHVRYLAKFYPVVFAVCAAGLEHAPLSTRAKRVMRGSVALALLLQIGLVALLLSNARAGQNIWMPD